MYVVKVGEYYVRRYEFEDLDGHIYISGIELSREIMSGFPKNNAVMLADKLNGTILEVKND